MRPRLPARHFGATRYHPRTRQPTFSAALSPHPPAGPDVLREQFRQAGPLRKGDRGHQTPVRHEIRVIEHHAIPFGA